MIAASCDVKKKDVETSNSENQGSKPDSESNSEKQDSKTDSESNSENQGSKPDSESNSEKQDSKTDGSSNKSTIPSESAPKDMPTENSEIDDYLDKVKKYGKETSEFANLLITLEGTEEAKELLNKYARILPIVKKFYDIYERLNSNSEETKKQTEEDIRDPKNKNNLLDLLNQYERSGEEIKAAIKKLKDLKNGK